VSMIEHHTTPGDNEADPRKLPEDFKGEPTAT